MVFNLPERSQRIQVNSFIFWAAKDLWKGIGPFLEMNPVVPLTLVVHSLISFPVLLSQLFLHEPQLMHEVILGSLNLLLLSLIVRLSTLVHLEV